MHDYTKMSATFDDTRKLRLTLKRHWSPGRTALVAMLNPSKGGEKKDDPTLRRLTEITKALGFGGYTVVNWSPFISSTPGPMFDFMREVYGKGVDAKLARYAMRKNIEVVKEQAEIADTIIAAWGNDFPASMKAGDELSGYTAEFLSTLMLSYNRDLMCFGVTKHGAPKHPLARGRHRIAANVRLMPWIGKGTRDAA